MDNLNENNPLTNSLNSLSKNPINEKPITLTSKNAFEKIHKYVFIKTKNYFDKISVEDIFWIESNQIHCKVQLKQNTYDLHYSLETCLQRFQHPDFIRVHDLFAINLQKVKSIVQIEGKKFLQISETVISTSTFLKKQIDIGGIDKIPIGRKYLKSFSDYFYML